VISAITVAELYAGVRDGGERQRLARLVADQLVLSVTEPIAVMAGLFTREWTPSHGVGLDDCLIAATAQLHAHTLITLNRRHFPMLGAVEVPYTR
jgi:predicted nucleic acid-binding protein